VSGIVFYLSGVLFSSFFFAPSITVLAALVLGACPCFPALFYRMQPIDC